MKSDTSLKAKPEIKQANPEWRLVRWQLQRTAQSLLPQERVAFCMRRCQAPTVDIMYSPSRQSAHYQGLMVCGSIWVCPLCAAKISERRRIELDQAIAKCVADGGSVYLATYTIAHNRYDNLLELLQLFLNARKKVKQGRAAQELRNKFDVLGTVSVREVTWSKLNGWHPHCHELVFFSQDIDAEAYSQAIRERWKRSAESEGLSMNEHGFKFDKTSGAVADYIAKFGREPSKVPWGAAAELTKAHLKSGHSDEHLTPFAMLSLIAQGCDELKPVFLEYACWFKGKHQLVWSAGLRSLLLENSDEKPDIELAEEIEEDVIVLGKLSREQWSVILRNDVRGKLLEMARSGDWQCVVNFLSRIGAVGGPAPPLLGFEYTNNHSNSCNPPHDSTELIQCKE
ncbi:MAG TPA: hypothetical protein VFQ36_05925 [Ktedonobacteraceae bacterium]|nr:hypothetical protein [Ktedonobacteraceae bacterium]